jgi:hypothetical protein
MMMSTHTTTTLAAPFIERLKQAVRVMEGLSEAERSNFTLHAWAVRTPAGICACIAGHCGLDPWFQERGFITTIEDESEGMGKVSMFPEMFFGTTDPFYPQLYRDVLLESATDVSPEAAVAALKNAIARFDTTTAS